MSTSLPERSLERYDEYLRRLPLRERKKLRTRKAIQDHALRLFTEQGYAATTVEQICAAAEISPSTFFRYFPTKEDVVITDEYDPILIEMFRHQPRELSPIEALRAALRDIFPYVYEQERETITRRTRLMLNEPALRGRLFEELRTGTQAAIAELAAERTGHDPGDQRVQVFAWAVLGAMMSALYAWLDSGGNLDLPALVDENLAFLDAGLPL
ncbi:TetR family transcriptional regulator [Actinomadura sp. NBRC 104412]|uniref:acyl-CoA-like ligand-binding transcription factor n=1 Tax=unclassified Actinomadura TaxID=2626254 RepID=UPI0024A2A632|nr:TetR family transcriptional regulator [Actinomadura sp. NBRC 104412]GLZ04965.1 TetR family transcriptional regulator [Actinomadura sp. NBRC 104412]